MAASRACASDEPAERAAEAALADGGGALDAIIAAFFGAAGADPAVLLSPITALVGGVGMGVRCLDGRTLQPGCGIARPRGFLPDEEIPAAARVGAPRSGAALAVLHAYGAALPLAALARQGTAGAKRQGAHGRAQLLTTVGQQGAAAFRAAEYRRSLLRAGGTAAGGLLTDEDLELARPADRPVEPAPVGGGLAAAGPPLEWTGARELSSPAPLRPARVVVAADERGVVAALCYAPDPDGVPVPEYDLIAPRDATPVRRGVSRITPATARPAAAPIALLDRREEGWFAAVALAGAPSLTPPDLACPEDGPLALRELLQRALTRCGGTAALVASAQRGRCAVTRYLAPGMR